eukprot:55812-Pleurochrysis_carterae.AAC.1
MEPLAPQRPPDAPGQIFAPRPMAASSSGFQPCLEAAYPDTGRLDRRSETIAMRMDGTTARMPDRRHPCDLR